MIVTGSRIRQMGWMAVLAACIALFAALIVWMYYRVAFVPGGQAIGALETVFAKLSKRVGRLFRRRRRLAAAPAE